MQHSYNVTDICNRSSCPHSNSGYATICDLDRIFHLYKEPKCRINCGKRVMPSENYTKALEIIDKHLTLKFMDETNIDAFAVCVGNVHVKYPAVGPNLKRNLLKELHQLVREKGVSFILHGSSGLSQDLVKICLLLVRSSRWSFVWKHWNGDTAWKRI